MRKYLVVYERAEDGGWGAYLPDLGGVVALGASRGEVADRIQEALDASPKRCRVWGDACRSRSPLRAA